MASGRTCATKTEPAQRKGYFIDQYEQMSAGIKLG
jgi:hypothetical protein